MKISYRFNIQKIFLLSSLYGSSFMLLAMGMGVCLIKSPTDKAQDHLAMAQYNEAQTYENKPYMPVRMFVLSQNDSSDTLTR
jgi:hypothetical protein